jgi:isopentenyl-diphosphate delta-isomerase
MIKTEQVVLVNEQDEQTGTMEKLEAHLQPTLHRAFSVFLFNSRHEMLLQQRAFTKYHSGGLWTNACCSHPRPGEATLDAAKRRMKEELGIEAGIEFAFHFTYQASFDNGLYEYEFDHVFTGIFNGEPMPHPSEVEAYCYKSITAIRQELQEQPFLYTEWFKIALPKLEEYLSHNYIGNIAH